MGPRTGARRGVRLKVWVEVSEERLSENFRAISEAAGAETEVLAVVKANAYGHGLERCAVMLAKAGTKWLGVTCANEGTQVRTALAAAGFPRGGDVTPAILVMCGLLQEDAGTVAEQGLTPVVWTAEQVASLAGTGVQVHVEVDTGMGRQGVLPGEPLDALLAQIESSGLILDGIFTHFCASEVASSGLTQLQQRGFEAAVAQVRAKALKPSWVHAGNSSTVDNPAQSWPWLVELAASVGARAMVRTGLALYGYCLPIEQPSGEGDVQPRVRAAIRPVMTWKTRVLAVRELAEGGTVGYGAAYAASAPMRIALLQVGYADGLRRELSSSSERAGGWVVLRGHRASVLGRISMNLTVVDVTGITRVAVGDEAILLGEGITAEDHARLAGTIAYEILCGVRER